jgi:diaminopimelate decarboxylase
MVTLVDGIDVASSRELKVALDAGANPAEISIAGPGKTDAELFQAVAAGALTNVESERELEVLARAARDLSLPARVAIRINPDFELKSSGMSMGGGPKQFGVDAERVPELLSLVEKADLTFEGFHVFAGSQNLNAEAIAEAQRSGFELVLKLAAHAPAPVKVINLGGGFGIPYFPGERRLDVAPIGRNLSAIVASARERLPGAAIVIELGRYLVGEAGVYVAKVIDRKISRGRVYLITDGGLHHHLAASGNFGQVIRKNYPLGIGTKTEAEKEQASVVGPLCTPLDVLGADMLLPRAQIGDLVVVFQSGAYGATASPQGFLSHPEVLEVLV